MPASSAVGGELHQLRRRRRRGDRVFVLQGLGGLGKTTLAGQLLPTLADEKSTVAIWCRRTEGEHDQAEAIVGQLLAYCRARFGTGFEQVVSDVDRAAGENSVQRFATFLQVLLQEQQEAPLAIYFDNLESLLNGPDAVSLESAPDSDAFGSWRSDDLRGIWVAINQIAGAVNNLFVVASCRYRNEDLTAYLLPVSPLADADLFRLMAWFPALRRLSTRSRARLASRLSGHPRAVEFLDTLVAASIRSWEATNPERTPPQSSNTDAVEREWNQLVAPALPEVQERIWSDLLLNAIWDRVLDERARRMLFRMTLLRRPWDDALIPHLGEQDEPRTAHHTARALSTASLLEQIDLAVRTRTEPVVRRHFTVHAATSAFVRSRFGGNNDDLAAESHRRIGTYLEAQASTSPDLSVDIEAGYHLFQAAEYDRAYDLLGSASERLQDWGRVREGLHILLPFLASTGQSTMGRDRVGRLLGIIGNAYVALAETRRAIDYYEQNLVIAREVGDRRSEGNALGGLGYAYDDLGEIRRGIDYYEQRLVIASEIGDRVGESAALANLGVAYGKLGETRRAIEYHEHALVIYREIGDRRHEGSVLGNLGLSYAHLGETRRAIEHYEQNLVIAREIGDPRGESAALGNLGIAYFQLGETRRAIDHYQQQLVMTREVGDRRGEGNALGNLGSALAQLGESQRAIELYQQRLVIAREIGDRQGEGIVLGNLGSAYAALGETRRAIEHYQQRLVIAREIGDRRGEGAALGNLGNAFTALGETRRATEHYEQSLAIGREISDPFIIEVCEHGLARLRGETASSDSAE